MSDFETVCFLSNNRFFVDELSGKKPFTIRVYSPGDPRFIALDKGIAQKVKIKASCGIGHFVRAITYYDTLNIGLPDGIQVAVIGWW